jgi:predicted permease
MLRDLRHGIRTLLQAKGWTAVVVTSLALGIGANTALFSAANSLLLTTLPVRDADSLVRLRWAGRNDMMTEHHEYGAGGTDALGRDVSTTFSYPMFRQFVEENRTMADLFACAPLTRVNVVVDGQAEIATGFASTGNYYRVLGVTARLGRTLVEDDDRPDAPPAAVISHRYWHARFGADPGVIGKAIQINNTPATIVGVLPPEFIGVQQSLGELHDVAVPLILNEQIGVAREFTRMDQPTHWWLQIMGHMKPGVAPAQVQANLGGVFQHTARAGFDSYLSALPDAERSLSRNQERNAAPVLLVDSGGRGVYDAGAGDVRTIRVLGIVVVLVLLIVCANVANLLLSRAAARQKELSVRLSFGASRARLIRQLLTESLLLASMGGALGIVIGHWGRRLLPGPAGEAAPLDWRVLAFAIGATVVTGLVFGIAPALRATRLNVSSALKENSRSIAGVRTRLGKALLIVQVAVSLVLLVGAGLFLRTLGNLRSVPVGFNPHNLALFRVSPLLNRYDQARTRTLYTELLSRLETIPGARAVGLSDPALLSGRMSSTGMFVQGRTYPPGRSTGNTINVVVVSPGFFEAMEIPLLAGRGFSDRDHADAPKVVVINDAAARKYFPGENPIGRRFGSRPGTSGELEIVGVLRDAKYNSLREKAPPTKYVPYTQQPTAGATFEVRTMGDPLGMMGAIRETVRAVDPNVPLMDVSTQTEQIERRFAQEKVFARACALFGALALTIAAVGLFGVMSYSVSRRTNEIGVRMALGARREDVLRLMMRESMVLVAAGVVIGVALAAAASRLVATLLFGLAPTDTLTIAGAIVTMVTVSALAGYLPARRAARVDPIVALRYE